MPQPGTPSNGYDWWKAVWKDSYANNGEKLRDRMVPGTSLWTVTSAGQTVASSKANAKDGLAGVLRQSLQMYAKLPDAERWPAKAIEDASVPMPAPPAGGLVLTVYDRPLLRDAEGRYRSGETPGHRVPGAARSSVWLTEGDCKALIPENAQKGSTSKVASKLAKRIFLFGLASGAAWHDENLWDPDSVREGDLNLTVEEVTKSGVRLRVHGSALLVNKNLRGEGASHLAQDVRRGLENRYDARLEGLLVYDLDQKRITRWDMVGLGDYVGIYYPVGYPNIFVREPVVIGFSFELDRTIYEVPAERRRQRPRLLAHDFKNSEQYYWDPEKWEEDWKKRQKQR